MLDDLNLDLADEAAADGRLYRTHLLPGTRHVPTGLL